MIGNKYSVMNVAMKLSQLHNVVTAQDIADATAITNKLLIEYYDNYTHFC